MIADCGLRIADLLSPGILFLFQIFSREQFSYYQSAIRNPQSAIRNPLTSFSNE